MSNLVPIRIVNAAGVETTVHVRPEEVGQLDGSLSVARERRRKIVSDATSQIAVDRIAALDAQDEAVRRLASIISASATAPTPPRIAARLVRSGWMSDHEGDQTEMAEELVREGIDEGRLDGHTVMSPIHVARVVVGGGFRPPTAATRSEINDITESLLRRTCHGVRPYGPLELSKQLWEDGWRLRGDNSRLAFLDEVRRPLETALRGGGVAPAGEWIAEMASRDHGSAATDRAADVLTGVAVVEGNPLLVSETARLQPEQRALVEGMYTDSPQEVSLRLYHDSRAERLTVVTSAGESMAVVTHHAKEGYAVARNINGDIQTATTGDPVLARSAVLPVYRR